MLGKGCGRTESIFAGDVVKAKKPDPAIYNLAAVTLGLSPKNIVVIEDSHIGLQAAKAAGMHCVVTMSPYTAEEDFSLADHIVEDLDQGIDLAFCKKIIG